MRPELIDILRIMPHRNPMLLVDAIEEGDDPESAVAYKNITFSEPCYRNADGACTSADLTYPLSLLIESFGQGAGLLLARRGFLDKAQSTSAVVFGELSAIEILGHAYPGDRLRHEVRLDNAGPQLAVFNGRTLVGDCVIMKFGSLKAFLVEKTTLTKQVQHA